MALRVGYKQTEVGAIPSDWLVEQLQSLAKIERGKFTARPRNDPRYYGGDIPFIQTGDVTNSNGLVTSFSQTLNAEGLKVSKLFPKGTLFFTIAANIGDIGFAAFDAACPDSLVAITTTKAVNKRWLAHELRQRKSIFESLASHNAQLNINLEKLRPYLLPVPTFLEQEAIAEALSDADALIESLEQVLLKKRQIKQGTMQELLTGKRRLPGFDGEWKGNALGDLVQFYKGKGLSKADLVADGLEPCIHYGELFTKYSETIHEIVSRTNLIEGVFRSISNDVLMPTSDVTPDGLAKASCVLANDVILGGDILVIRADAERVCGSFLSYLIRQEREQVLSLVTGSTVFHLYASDMKRFQVCMPGVVEQRAIVLILSDMDADLAALESRLAKARHIKQGMMQQLLTGQIRLV